MKRDINKIFSNKILQSPIGKIHLAVCEKGLIAIQIGGDDESFLQKWSMKFGVAAIPNKSKALRFSLQVQEYLHGQRQVFDFPIHWDVLSPFQQKVLRQVLAIPYGETRTYRQIATQIKIPRAARAVGRANATNPMPVVIPCHRVIGTDGSLRGYAGGEGIKTKQWLLDFETSMNRDTVL